MTLNFSTYISGNQEDECNRVALDGDGNAYIVGFTSSTNLAVRNAYQSTFQGGTYDAFVMKINATYNSLVYCTYLGGSSIDKANDIAVDQVGNCYIAGVTSSSDFPTHNAYNSIYGGGTYDAFVVKLNSTGGIEYSTFLGGDNNDVAYGMTIDADGNVYACGYTQSTNFPTQNAYQSSHSTTTSADWFITKLNSNGNALNFSTFFGGTSSEFATSITLDAEHNVYVGGYVMSGFPTKNAFQSSHGGGIYDAGIAKFNATGDGLNYSTYLGGSGSEEKESIVVDQDGNCYITGQTSSSNFPLKDPIDATYNGKYSDVFLTKLNCTGNGIFYSTYIGGCGDGSSLIDDIPHQIKIDQTGCSYIVGETTSADFPMVNEWNRTLNGGRDVFFLKVNETGTGINYSTFIGGDTQDSGNGIAIDTDGNCVIAGTTSSSNFPTQNPIFNDQYNTDGFFLRFIINQPSPGVMLVNAVNQSTLDGNIFIDIAIWDNSSLSQVLYDWDKTPTSVFSPPYDTQSPLVEGVHDLNVAACNGHGLWTNHTYRFDIMNVPPIISLENAINNSWHSSVILLDFTISDVVGLHVVQYAWDGAAYADFSSPYDINIPSTETKHQIWIYANDTAGNAIECTYTFYIDYTVPTINLQNAANNSWLTSAILLDFAISDSEGLHVVQYEWDGALYADFNSPYDTNIPSTETTHQLRIYANDTAGNAIECTYTFFMDSTPPAISLQSLQNNSIIPANTPLEFNIVDGGFLSSVKYRWDGDSDVELTAPFRINGPVSPGTHVLLVIATDAAGNAISVNYTFTIEDPLLIPIICVVIAAFAIGVVVVVKKIIIPRRKHAKSVVMK